MIKSLVFDIGGILIKESGTESRKNLEKKFNLHSEKFKEFAIKNLQNSFKGLHYSKFFRKMIKELKLNHSGMRLTEEWVKARNKISIWNKNVENLIKQLKKHYNVSCNTNTTILNDKSNARIRAYKLFDFCIKSTKIKSAKPEKAIYLATIKKLKQHNIKSEEAIFIDDQQENLPQARKLKFHTILFTNINQLKLDLKKLGVKWRKYN